MLCPLTTDIRASCASASITRHPQVEGTSGHSIPGLNAAGEIVGGLYYHNYASGTGLMAGAVFGRLAGRNAAASAKG